MRHNAHFYEVPKCRWPGLAASVDVGKLGEMKPQGEVSQSLKKGTYMNLIWICIEWSNMDIYIYKHIQMIYEPNIDLRWIHVMEHHPPLFQYGKVLSLFFQGAASCHFCCASGRRTWRPVAFGEWSHQFWANVWNNNNININNNNNNNININININNINILGFKVS